MAKFLTRVELHDAKHGDDTYEKLHKAMESRGFVRKIPTKGGIRKLPTAEYYCVRESTAMDVCLAAKELANTTGKKSEIVVAELANYHTLDLPPADK